jgi:predicted nucleic acid-binding protein
MDEARGLILADSSAWIEYLRRSESEIDLRVDALIREGALAVTEPVAMEVLAGASDEEERERLRRLLARPELLPVTGFDDYQFAASIQQQCRAAEGPAHSIVACLIASVAIRNGVTVLHRNRDFDLIARHTPLRVAA